MIKKHLYIVLCPALLLLWLFPVLYGSFSLQGETIKTLLAYLLFCVAAVLCRLLPNRYAALGSTLPIASVMCVLWFEALFDLVPALLLCCWLRCYLEQEKGTSVRVCFEIVTDLIYASAAAGVIRLIINGYAMISIFETDTLSIPELCLMGILFFAAVVLFLTGAGNKTAHTSAKDKKQKTRGSGRQMAGLIPVYTVPRTFWGFCVVLLTVSFLQYTNGRLTTESYLFNLTGFRLLFLPWMVLLFLVLEVFLPRTNFGKRFHQKQ